MAPDHAARAQSRNAPPQARAPDTAATRAAYAYASGEWTPPAAADTRPRAQPDAPALPRRTDAPAPSPANDLYLDVSLNGEPTHLIVHFAIVDGRAFASEDDLNDLGIATSRLRQPANALVALDALDGLRYRYDATRQTMALVVPDALRIPHTLDTRALAPSAPASAGRGAVLNYDLYTQTAGGASAALWHEARYFDPAGVFSSTGVAAFQHAGQRYTRYDTSWSRSDPASLSTMQIGDTI